MTKKQENEASRLKEVLSYLQANDTTFAPIPNYSVTKAMLDSASDKLLKLIDAQQVNLKAYTLDKEEKTADLMQTMVEEAGKLNLLAIDTADTLLQGQSKITKTQLLRLRDTLLSSKARALYSAIDTNLPALATYGTTAVSQADFKLKIDKYSDIIDQRSVASNQRQSYLNEIGLVLKTVSPIIKRLRLLIGTLHSDTLLQQFNNVSRVKNLGARHYNLEGTVTDDEDGLAIHNAQVSIYDLKGASHTAVTNELGYYHFKSISQGEYKAIFTKKGFFEHSITFEVIAGKLNKLDASLAFDNSGETETE